MAFLWHFNILHTILRNLFRNSCCLSCVVPGKQCLYQGLTMFDQAMWSPTSCVTCLCTGGQVVCEEVSCPTMHCYFPFTPVGECCPICMESGKTPMGTRVKGGTPTDSSYNWVSDHLWNRLAIKLIKLIKSVSSALMLDKIFARGNSALPRSPQLYDPRENL